MAALAGHQGDADAARALLDDPEPAVRATALGALQRLGCLALDELTAAMADPATGRAQPGRRGGCGLAGRRPPEPARRCWPTPIPPSSRWPRGPCGEREPPEPAVVGALSAIATGHDDALCREAAVAALGRHRRPGRSARHPRAPPRDKATVRRRAVIALAPFDGPEVDAALEAARTDRDWQVRQAAEDLLAE